MPSQGAPSDECGSDDFAALVRSFREHVPPATSAPELAWTVPPEWGEADLEARYWREAHASGIFELEMAMASELLRKLLEQNKYLRASCFARWPSRDRHQLWATAWLALRLLPGRAYSAAEFDALVERHLVGPEPSLLFAVRSELERRGFAVAAEGDQPEGTLALSRPAVQFLLDGDKLFQVRACVVHRRPWWALPLAAQYAAAPRPTEHPNPTPYP